MNFLDFTDCKRYFNDPLPLEAEHLVSQACGEIGNEADAELALLRAHLLAPENLTVLVGLYRYYFYRHRLTDAVHAAERAMRVSARQLGLPADWEQLDESSLGIAANNSLALLRFYLLAFKAVSVMLLRLGRVAASRARLSKLAALDRSDQLGAARLLEVLDEFKPCGILMPEMSPTIATEFI